MHLVKKLKSTFYSPFNNQLIKLRQAFIDSYGSNIYERIFEYLKQNEIYDECLNLKNVEQLFEFSVKYGILEFVKFLYEHKNVTYNYNIITRYCHVIESSSSDANMIKVTASSGNEGMNIQLLDKYGFHRQSCLSYLIGMKKYSKLTTRNKNFYYTFNPKYLQTYRTMAGNDP